MGYLIEADKLILSRGFFITSVSSKERRYVSPRNMQWFNNWSKGEERSVLALGYLCLHCCERDKAC